MPRLRDRPTSDLVIVFLAAIVGFVMVVMVVGVMVLKIAHPDEDVDANLRVIADVLTVLVGAVVGYVAGKATVNGVNGINGNGKKGPP